MSFKPIPDESKISGKVQFTTRRIRRIGDKNLLIETQKLLVCFESDGEEMLISEMSDCVDALHRSALLVQRTKQNVLLSRLRNTSRQKIKHKKE